MSDFEYEGRYAGIEFGTENGGHPAISTSAVRSGQMDYILARPDALREIADRMEEGEGDE